MMMKSYGKCTKFSMVQMDFRSTNFDMNFVYLKNNKENVFN